MLDIVINQDMFDYISKEGLIKEENIAILPYHGNVKVHITTAPPKLSTKLSQDKGWYRKFEKRNKWSIYY